MDLGILNMTKDTKEKDPQIAASFMRAGIYDPSKFGHVVSMPKLNGLRCMYIPGRGFFSRDGKRWNDAVLNHIIPPTTDYILDGELYCHGMSLQKINAAVAVSRIEPGQDAELIEFRAFDLVEPKYNALTRMLLLDKIFADSKGKTANIRPIQWSICKTRIELDMCYHDYLDQSYEGQMLKSVFGSYMPQGTVTTSQKVKNPKTGKMETVVKSTPGFSQASSEARITEQLKALNPDDFDRAKRVEFSSWISQNVAGA